MPAIEIGFMFSVLSFRNTVRLRDEPSPLNHANQQDDHGQHQKNVNESSHCVGADHSKGPQNDENYTDCPKHLAPFVALIYDEKPLNFVAFQ
jgi:hypothetical protein